MSEKEIKMNQTLRQWMQLSKPGETMIWRDAVHDQFKFFERLTDLVARGLPYEQYDDLARVIGTHLSKSIELPVVQWTRPDLGVTFTMRDNFHDYKLSVSSDRPIDDPVFPALFNTAPPIDPAYTGNPLADCYFEGFPSVLVYGYQSQNQRVWSASIGGSHAAYMVVFLCMRALGAIPDLTWARDPRR